MLDSEFIKRKLALNQEELEYLRAYEHQTGNIFAFGRCGCLLA